MPEVDHALDRPRSTNTSPRTWAPLPQRFGQPVLDIVRLEAQLDQRRRSPALSVIQRFQHQPVAVFGQERPAVPARRLEAQVAQFDAAAVEREDKRRVPAAFRLPRPRRGSARQLLRREEARRLDALRDADDAAAERW